MPLGAGRDSRMEWEPVQYIPTSPAPEQSHYLNSPRSALISQIRPRFEYPTSAWILDSTLGQPCILSTALFHRRSQPTTHATNAARRLVFFQVATRDVVACQASTKLSHQHYQSFFNSQASHPQRVGRPIIPKRFVQCSMSKDIKLRGTCHRCYQDSTAKNPPLCFSIQISGFLSCFL